MTSTPIPPLPGTDDSERGQSLRREQHTRPGLPPRRLTLASFDNLVVLANYEEHLREARKMVWRDRGEPAVEVHDLWECLEHGLRGGLRASQVLLLFCGFSQLDDVLGAGTLAFAIRSGVNLILLLARIQRARKMSRFVQGPSVGCSLECPTDRHVHAGKRVFRLCNMRSSEQTRSVLVPCSVCLRFSISLG